MAPHPLIDKEAPPFTILDANGQTFRFPPEQDAKQKLFVDKNNLSFPVLSDQDYVAHKAFQVGKGMFGLMDARTTFVIDSKGIVRGVLNSTMNYSAHVKFVIKHLEKIQEPKGVHVEASGSAAEEQPERDASPPAPASSSERDELGRVADMVSA
ncbi:hypothetical protein ID866_6089 [Astraeus odoratus]|nr:hypothetical protein ID866_6089 [Astraeus odoratus]